jgi:SAM-dependent methyltransferase
VTEPPLTVRGWLRYDVVARLLAGLTGVESVLEVGAGEGAVGVRLARRYRYVGIEPDAESFATARRRGLVVHGDLGVLPADATFDLVCAFEVLEHVEDDAAVLREWTSHLRPGGWVILSVPAFARSSGPWTAGRVTSAATSATTFAAVMVAGGLEPVSIQLYGYPLANMLAAVRSALARVRPAEGARAERTASSGRYLQPPDRLGWLTRTVSAPGRVAQRRFRERGHGFVALARRE